MKFTSKFARFFSVAALAGVFFFFTPTHANAQRGFYGGRGYYGHPSPRVVVRGGVGFYGAPYYGGYAPGYVAPGYAPGYVAPYYEPAPVVVAPSIGFGFGYGYGHPFYGRGGYVGRGGFRGRR